MSSPNPYQGTGDTGTSQGGPNIASHMTGNPHAMMSVAAPSSLHTWLIIAVAVGLLWALGAGVFKSIRMG